MKRTKLYIFFALALLPLVLNSSSFAKGFLGKRNMFDYDLSGGPLSKSQSFAYTRIKSNHFAYRFGYSRNNFTVSDLLNNGQFEVNTTNYYNPYFFIYYTNLHVTQNPVFHANTYSIGFVFSSSYANLDLPVGYFAAYTIYRTKGGADLHLSVPVNEYVCILDGHSRDIIGTYSFTQIGSTFDIGKTYYFHPGITLSLGMQMGAYLRFTKESFNEPVELTNLSTSPLADIFGKYPYTLPRQIPYSLNLVNGTPFGIGFSFMPFLRLGYLF